MGSWLPLIGGAAAGAFLTLLGTLYSGYLSRRHEHRRWLLDKRLQAYTEFLAVMAEWEVLYRRVRLKHIDDSDMAEVRDLSKRLAASVRALRLLAPQNISNRATRTESDARVLLVAATKESDEREGGKERPFPDKYHELWEHVDVLINTQQQDLGAGQRSRRNRGMRGRLAW
ncbi:hypothetical protein SAMN05660359_04480 [Geodermatophilus obscurus]|uniref:Uncharacterized protein n=2 Tax=Geodermatophilus obscurus TaxID=1861 RepID=A0A1I5IDB9_9ACTN|nr:hypothetical protein SAMN05660359_04480 [Geodermatophilus obscurus]